MSLSQGEILDKYVQLFQNFRGLKVTGKIIGKAGGNHLLWQGLDIKTLWQPVAPIGPELDFEVQIIPEVGDMVFHHTDPVGIGIITSSTDGTYNVLLEGSDTEESEDIIAEKDSIRYFFTPKAIDTFVKYKDGSMEILSNVSSIQAMGIVRAKHLLRPKYHLETGTSVALGKRVLSQGIITREARMEVFAKERAYQVLAPNKEGTSCLINLGTGSHTHVPLCDLAPEYWYPHSFTGKVQRSGTFLLKPSVGNLHELQNIPVIVLDRNDFGHAYLVNDKVIVKGLRSKETWLIEDVMVIGWAPIILQDAKALGEVYSVGGVNYPWDQVMPLDIAAYKLLLTGEVTTEALQMQEVQAMKASQYAIPIDWEVQSKVMLKAKVGFLRGRVYAPYGTGWVEAAPGKIIPIEWDLLAKGLNIIRKYLIQGNQELSPEEQTIILQLRRETNAM
jgi:hypothetical protein